MADENNVERENLFGKQFDELKKLWDRIPKPMRILILAIGVFAIAGGVALAVFDRTDEQVLFSGLSEQDAASVIEQLKAKKVPYRIEAGGGAILVPAASVHELRLELAGLGIPTGGGVGFELFDQQRFGMTEFEERVAMRRALEGELSRTISGLGPVKSARVHLVLPKRSLLGKNATVAEGAVILKLQPGRELSGGTVQSIVHLVSSSVEGLNTDHVTIVDTRGKLLSSENGSGSEGREIAYKRKYERDLEVRVHEMLSRILGADASVVRVSGDFDFSQRETTEEHYDPERSVLRSEQRETETSGSSSAAAGGVPGARSNLPGAEIPAGGKSGQNSKREAETRNYEVDRVVNRVVGSGTQLTRLTVAVLVSGTNADGEKFAPRSATELKKIDTAVRNAIGFDVRRGDQVSVQSVPFHIPEEIEVLEQGGAPWWREWLPLIISAAVALALIIVILSFRRKKGAAPARVPVESLEFPQKLHELEAIIERPDALAVAGQTPAVPERSNTAMLMGDVRQVFLDDSENASRVLASWLSESKEPEKENQEAS